MMRYYFISDLHLDDEKCRLRERQRYESLEDVKQTMMDSWNKSINSEDMVYILGDVTLKRTKPNEIDYLNQLNGRKVLIRGNHDHGTPDYIHGQWAGDIQDLLTVKHPTGQKIALCHYPLECWDGSHYGTFHLHGHLHGTGKKIVPNRFDVYMNAENKFKPYSFEEICVRIQVQNKIPFGEENER